jgi:hypothetical protein
MAKKKGNIVELYLDKAVLVLIVIAAIAVLWFFIVAGPYSVEYRNQKLGPGEVDEYIERNAASELERELNKSPEPRVYDKNYYSQFQNKLDNAIGEDVSLSLDWPRPGRGNVIEPDRKYAVPSIPSPFGVSADHIRSVVHYPSEPVDPEHRYSDVVTELKDIDFVTVEASIDVESLFDSFEESFNDPRKVKAEWRSRDFANPVFADIDLQRRRKQSDGSWGEWESVSPTKIDYLSGMYDFPEKASELDYGIDLLMLEFNDELIRRNILQPVAYEFAASDVKWYPPKLHSEYEKLSEQLRQKEERERMEARRERIERERSSRRDRTPRRDGGGGMPGMGMPGGGGMPGMGMPGGEGGGRDRDRRDSRRSRGRRGRGDRREKTLDDIEQDYQDILLSERNRLQNMREPLVFWANDDSVEPGNSYQYRIRLGVFNPIAGKDWFREEQSDYKDEVILWSSFSDVTSEIQVPKMIHFFAVDMATEENGGVRMEVAKFYMAKWRIAEFDVLSGEAIGKEIEQVISNGSDDEDDDRDRDRRDGRADRDGRYEREEEKELVDYRTGATMVDVVEVSDYAGVNVYRQRDYNDVLYTYDGEDIERMAVRSRNWPDDIQKQYSSIKSSASEDVEIIRQRGAEGVRRGTPGGVEGMPGMMEGMPGMPGMMP